MKNIAVFPNVEKEDAPEVLARIFRFFADKDVRLLMPTDSAAFFHYEKYGVEEEKRYVPAVVIGERYLFAGDEIIAQLAEALTAGEGLQTPLLNGAERQP